MEADVVCHKYNVKQPWSLETVKRMLYLGYVFLRFVPIYNLEVSLNFHLTFLQLNAIKMFTVQQKLFFSLLLAIFFELPITRTPDNSKCFRFQLHHGRRFSRTLV